MATESAARKLGEEDDIISTENQFVIDCYKEELKRYINFRRIYDQLLERAVITPKEAVDLKVGLVINLFIFICLPSLDEGRIGIWKNCRNCFLTHHWGVCAIPLAFFVVRHVSSASTIS